jgi:nucleotide-binding universal stress UspA family protein
VSVVETVPYDGDFTGPEFRTFRELRQQHAAEALDAALSPEVRSRCHVEDRIVYGKPSQQILAVAQQLRPDVIVMGVQGRGALDLMVFGSTVNEVVRQAEHPVLTVRLPRPGD